MKFQAVAFCSCTVMFIIEHCVAAVIIRKRSSVVETSNGPINGMLVEFPRNNFKMDPIEAFFGVSYASRGNFRFMQATVYSTMWSGVRNMEDFGPPCYQRQIVQWNDVPDITKTQINRLNHFLSKAKEDCLTLNLYRPINKGSNETTLFPVMVFIHGESYDTGTGNAYDGSVLASYGEVIVITVNYRLGVLGFLNLGHPDAYGNQALSDIRSILSWVKENIGYFGGDKDSVTVFGHGHGAALVNILMLMPDLNEEKLFRRAILQSGSAFSSWAFSVDNLACAERLAMNVNCTNHINSTADLLICLKNKSAKELVKEAPIPPKYKTCFAPTLSGYGLFGESLSGLLDSSSSLFSNVDIMFGVTKNEAYAFMKQDELELGVSNFRKSQIIRTYVQNNFKYHRQKIYEILEHQYSDWDRSQDNLTRRDNMMELISDGQYAAPLVKMALRHAVHNVSSYFYMFGYSTQSEDYPKWSSGVHGDELPYIFGAPLVDGISPFPDQYSKAEKRISASIMRMWTNFAKSGNPNVPKNRSSYKDDKFRDIVWPRYTPQRQQYLQIGRRPLVRHHYRGKQLALWLDLIPKIDEEIHDSTGKPDSAEHNLKDPKNMSTFDDPNRLLIHFHRISALKGSSVQMTSPQKDQVSKATNSNYVMENETITESFDTYKLPSDALDKNHSLLSRPTELPQTDSLAHKSVPLSIIVAIGCSLLFINILVLAAVCYQRKRIQSLRRGNLQSKDDQFTKLNKPITSEEKTHEIDKCMEIQSSKGDAPQRNAIYSQPIKPIRTMYQVRANSPVRGYSYSPVSTISSSPLHKEKVQHTTTNSISAPYKEFSTFQAVRPPEDKVSGTSKVQQHAPVTSTTTVV